MVKVWSYFVAIALVSTIAPSSKATGLLVARFGGEWGHPMSGELWSIYYNPAGLSLLGGTRLALSGSFAWRSFTYTRDAGAIDQILEPGQPGAGTPAGEGVAVNSGEASLFNVIASPFFAVGSDFGIEGFGAALGFYVPFGGQSAWDQTASSDTFPGAVDGPQRWWTIEGTIRSMYATGALAYRIEPLRLSFGLGLNVVISQIDNVLARAADGTDDLVAGGGLKEGRARIDVSSVDLALSAGLLWEPIDELVIGVSYQSQPNFGPQTLSGEVDLAISGGPITGDLKQDADVTQSMPDVVRFGVRYGEPKCWQVRAFADWARWSVLDKQCILNTTSATGGCGADSPRKIIIIPRYWQDAWGVRLSGSWWASEGLELVFGGGWDGSAVPDETVEPALYDGDKLSFTLGAKLSLDGGLDLSLQYTQLVYPDRDIAPRGRVTDASGRQISDLSQAGIPDGERSPDAAGLYQHSIGVVELSAQYRF